MTGVCPDATMLNYVNPMAMNTWAMYARYPHIKQVGLCHSVQGTAEELARDLNIDPATLRYRCAGIKAKPVKTIKDKVRAMRELLLSDEYAEQKRAVNRFMLLLSTLYSLDAQAFAEATESLHGRTRVYFAADEQTLQQHRLLTVLQG